MQTFIIEISQLEVSEAKNQAKDFSSKKNGFVPEYLQTK